MEDQTHQTKRVIEKLYACADSGDMQGIQSLIHEDVVAYEPPFMPYARECRGAAAFFATMGEVAHYLDISNVTLDYIIADGDTAVARTRIPVIAGGEARLLEEYVVKDGRIVELRIFFNDVGSVPLSSN